MSIFFLELIIIQYPESWYLQNVVCLFCAFNNFRDIKNFVQISTILVFHCIMATTWEIIFFPTSTKKKKILLLFWIISCVAIFFNMFFEEECVYFGWVEKQNYSFILGISPPEPVLSLVVCRQWSCYSRTLGDNSLTARCLSYELSIYQIRILRETSSGQAIIPQST